MVGRLLSFRLDSFPDVLKLSLFSLFRGVFSTVSGQVPLLSTPETSYLAYVPRIADHDRVYSCSPLVSEVTPTASGLISSSYYIFAPEILLRGTGPV